MVAGERSTFVVGSLEQKLIAESSDPTSAKRRFRACSWETSLQLLQKLCPSGPMNFQQVDSNCIKLSNAPRTAALQALGQASGTKKERGNRAQSPVLLMRDKTQGTAMPSFKAGNPRYA